MARPRNMEGHRDDIPGLLNNAAWCNNCRNYCGGEGPRCSCCGGTPAEEKEKSVADVAMEQSGVPVPGGTQVSPSAGPGRQGADQEGNLISESESTSGSGRRGRRRRGRPQT